jgi:hypothetical protein
MPKSNGIEMMNQMCPQCNTYHPPLQAGQLCPMAKGKTNSGEEIDLTDFFSSLKNILLSQIKIKNIKNMKRILAFTLINVTKLLERYEEK